jgi:hypothetical protein
MYRYLNLCEKVYKEDLKVELPKDLWYHHTTPTQYCQKKNWKKNKRYQENLLEARELAPLVIKVLGVSLLEDSPLDKHRDEVFMAQWAASCRGVIKRYYSLPQIARRVYTPFKEEALKWVHSEMGRKAVIGGALVILGLLLLRYGPELLVKIATVWGMFHQ